MSLPRHQQRHEDLYNISSEVAFNQTRSERKLYLSFILLSVRKKENDLLSNLIDSSFLISQFFSYLCFFVTIKLLREPVMFHSLII